MNDNEALPPRAVPHSHRRDVALTHVELTWIEKRIEHWLRFGRRTEGKILDRRRSISSFTPGSIFGFVRWASNDYGTVVSRMDIVRAVESGQRYQTLPFVRPGGEILLRVDNWPMVERVLQAVDAIEALAIDPAAAAPEYWRHLHNRLAAGHEPRAYTREQHVAWLKRRSVTP
ncbi:DUF2840 domain-containing protein [Bradyrhizobium sp. 173]|uniref:DUF2840 domain-containing protein n=1 Tax=Bradyrhizobium sp. 173 TaxID=2782644 RepID=UPI001FF84535|nr:DUF2840 domain-containing protein [Bradyrhizobium sp. 173]MCK1568790.1 DUF2840 domain-containing protein [Bradyrhizobium sp. 173]